MGAGPNNPVKAIYKLVILLIVLQAAAIGLVLRFAADSVERDNTLLDRTGTMMDQVFPGIKQEIGEVAQKATEIKSDISRLSTQVAKVDEHVGEVGHGVSRVQTQVQKMDNSLTGFVDDRSGLMWGHSLNPYLLFGGILILIALVPASGWLFGRKRSTEPAKSVARVSESFSAKLDRLSTLVQDIRKEGETDRPSAELERLMIETERLIREARLDLGQRAPIVEAQPPKPALNRDELH
mgnify:FL=1